LKTIEKCKNFILKVSHVNLDIRIITSRCVSSISYSHVRKLYTATTYHR